VVKELVSFKKNNVIYCRINSKLISLFTKLFIMKTGKIILNVLILFGLCFNLNAQELKYSDPPLPLDPNVKIGELKNGIKYYIRYNKKPEKRAEFRLVINAGSIQEDVDQQGLAHLTEHMAFNGSEHFERNDLIDYLESVGVKFGAHLNAYTSFDETVYMFKIPTDSPSIVDKGFQILEDWAHGLSFDEKEIDKERGVVGEEWRLWLGADERMRNKYWPVLFHGSRYAERLPIGKKGVIDTASYETIKRFYKDWYRPDLMAVVAVGDFDVSEIEKKIEKHFSNIKPVEDPRERNVYELPDHDDTKVVIATDKEASSTIVRIYYKHDKKEERTIGDYRESMIRSLYNGMINKRLSELQREADPPFTYAYTYYGDVVRTKDAYVSVGMVKEKEVMRGLETLLMENKKVLQFGFTQSELDRQKEGTLRSLEQCSVGVCDIIKSH